MTAPARLDGSRRCLQLVLSLLAHGLLMLPSSADLGGGGLTALGVELKAATFESFVQSHPHLANEKVFVYELPERFNVQYSTSLVSRAEKHYWNMLQHGGVQ